MNSPIISGQTPVTYSVWAYTESTEAMDIMGQFCLNQENDCQNDILLALNKANKKVDVVLKA